MTLYFNAASHVGHKRAANEDSWFARRQDDGALLLAVADGMGGAPGGDQASALAVAAFAATETGDALLPHDLPRLAMAGHKAILDRAASDSGMKGMGTTLTAALVRKAELSWVHIGDSRLYTFASDSQIHAQQTLTPGRGHIRCKDRDAPVLL